MPIKIGNQYILNYPDFGAPNGRSEYTAHSGQLVTVLSEVEVDEEFADNRLYAVEATDGWTGQVWAEELLASA